MKKATLDIIGRGITVDMSQNLFPQGNKANLTIAEVKGRLTLPKKSKLIGWKTILPKADFKYEIKLTGDAGNKDVLSESCFSANPITCKIQGSQQRASSGTFHVETCDTELELIFDASKVKDCPQTLTEDRKFNLPFQLLISDETSTFTIDDYLEVTIKQFSPSLLFQFISNYSDDNRLVYSESDTCKEVGILRVSHNAVFNCAPDIEGERFTIMCTVKEGEADETSESIERKDLLFLKDSNNRMNTTYKVEKLTAGQHIDIPVFFNVTDAGNPASVDFPNIYTPTIKNHECNGSFKLHRNKILTKKRVFFQMPNMQQEDGDITNCNSKDLGELFLVQQADMDYTLTLTFMNEADATDIQHPNASVLVWGVAIDSISVNQDGANRILTRNKKSLNDIFRLTADANKWALNPRFGKKCHLDIKLKAGDIESIIPCRGETETYVDLKLCLKYHAIEDHEGRFFSAVMKEHTDTNNENNDFKDNKKGLHTCDLNIRLKKQPQSEWLCVDFGTSAVVAAFARDTRNDHNALIDLKKLKGHMLDIAYGKNSARNSIEDEDDNLISSTVCFHNHPNTIDYHCVDGNPETFMKYAVWFSPSVNDMDTKYLLPCLKTIIGYKHLPNIFAEKDIEIFQYRYGDSDNTIGLRDEQGNPTPLMEVNEVAKIIYRQLFKYYLAHRLGRNGNNLELRTVNKLVLSVPNTYTPLNVQVIKDLARDSMPDIYPEYLHTISESDAVACYYVSHRQGFLNSIKNSERKDQLAQKESVLVYDMGAGTLDLTWFVKTEQKDESGKIIRVDVDIKGKLGVSKAGNYLDYELAEVWRELCQNNSTKGGGHKKHQRNDEKFEQAMLLDRSKVLDDMADEEDRMKLKNYMKGLKKMLSHPDVIVPRLEMGSKVYIEGEQTDDAKNSLQHGAKLKMRDILEHKHFKRIIDEMTQEVLENFGARYGDKDGKLDIDVLIFSGRSTSLKAIREGVRNHIGSICHRPDELLYADLCAEKLSDDIQQTTNTDNSLLKTVVTQGALAYATMFSREDSSYKLHSKKYYASFGLMKHYSDHSYEYVPLIDDRCTEKIEEKEGIIKSQKYKVSVCDLNQIDLIQSYSSNEEEDYRIGKFDTITKLSELPCQEFQEDFDVQLIMNTKSDNAGGTTLTFWVDKGRQSLDPHDDFDNLSLRKSLWPVIFDTGENPNN